MAALIPSMTLRWVDVSTIPHLGARMVLQQRFTNARSGSEVWIDVPNVGHISEIESAPSPSNDGRAEE